MNRSLAPIIMAVMLLSIGSLLYFSMESVPKTNPAISIRAEKLENGPSTVGDESAESERAAQPVGQAGFREYPIGNPEGFERNHIRVAAVWLPAVTMDGGPMSSDSAIHVEADITATEANPNGFAAGEFVPYLKISYKLMSSDGKTILDQGEMLPMVARDGLHYGTSMIPPKAGEYQLAYRIEPPSVGGLGRHHDPVTGVAPWWEPFEVVFDWEFDGVDADKSLP